MLGERLPIVPPEKLPEFEANLARVLGGDSFSGMVLERRRRDGRTIEIELSTAPLHDESGEVVGVMSLMADVSERRRAERALVASEARTAAVLEAALDCVITIDHEGRIVEFNPSAEETFGWTSGEVLGRSFLDVTIPRAAQAGLAETLRTGAGPLLGARLEIEALRSDDRPFSAELVLSRVGVDGPPLFTACLRDITRRKAQQEQLRETVAKFRTLVERLPIATYVNELGLPVRTTWISPQIEQMLGYLPEEWLVPGFFEERVHPDDRERVLAEVERTHTTADTFRSEYRLVGKDRRVVWVRDETVAVRDEEYRPLFLQGFLVDVSEQHESDEALKRSELLYRLVVENSTDSITLLGLDGSVVHTSPATQRLLGWSPEELQGRPFQDVVHPDDVEATSERLRASVLGDGPMPSSARVRHRDGHWVRFRGTSHGIVDDDGTPVGMLVLARVDAADDAGSGGDGSDADEPVRVAR